VNVLRIAAKEIKVFRDPQMLIFMLAAPVLLILILGTALSGAFDGSAYVDDIRIVYHRDAADPAAKAGWEAFLREAERAGIRFDPAEGSRAEILRDVQGGRYTGAVWITENGVEYAGNERRPVENGIVRGMLAAFAEQMKLNAALAGRESEEAGAAPAAGGGAAELVRETSVHAARQPGSMDYYAVAVTTLIILYSAMTAGLLMENERSRNTAVRLLASPVGRMEILAGKVLGSFGINAVFVLVIVFLSMFMYGADWGEGARFGWVLLVLFSQIVFALGLGLSLSYLIPGKASGGVIMMIIQLEAFIGGAYFSIDTYTGFLRTLSELSPLGRTNRGIMQIIYADNAAGALPALAINIGGAVLMLGLAAVLLRRREGL
jgi:ABC-2 type transport system permease protein